MLCSHIPSLSQYFPLTLCKASSMMWLHPSSLCMSTCESQSPHRLDPLCSPFWFPPACLSTCSPCDTGLSWTALSGTLAVTVAGTVSLWSFSLCGISCWRKVITAPQSLSNRSIPNQATLKTIFLTLKSVPAAINLLYRLDTSRPVTTTGSAGSRLKEEIH